MRFGLFLVSLIACAAPSPFEGIWRGTLIETVSCPGQGPVEFEFQTSWGIKYSGPDLIADTGGLCGPVHLMDSTPGTKVLTTKTCLNLSGMELGTAELVGDKLQITTSSQLVFDQHTSLPNGCSATEKAVLIREK